MKLVKVKNKLMHYDKNPEGIHYYGFWWNKKYKRYNAVRLTHVSYPDPKRYNQANNGIISTARIRKLDKYADSGITRDNYISDIHGKRLSPNMGIIIDNNVSSSLANKIKKNIKYKKSRTYRDFRSSCRRCFASAYR